MRVNLSGGSMTTPVLPDDFAIRYLRGRGIGVMILDGENPLHAGPFSPENSLILIGSPIMGTIAP
ncbi:MAG: aldehyde ferredoxin oxidoreductase N-terminal domain-containing protein [bacterium]